jgi:BMFP domain-containing protein YqiC
MLCIGVSVEIVFPVKNGKPWLTRKDALAKFKEAKELFDLGVITKEEFDKKTEVLKKTILGI